MSPVIGEGRRRDRLLQLIGEALNTSPHSSPGEIAAYVGSRDSYAFAPEPGQNPIVENLRTVLGLLKEHFPHAIRKPVDPEREALCREAAYLLDTTTPEEWARAFPPRNRPVKDWLPDDFDADGEPPADSDWDYEEDEDDDNLDVPFTRKRIVQEPKEWPT
jgi:hypothetical protein